MPVKLQGISLKGKNRVREYGELWKVIREDGNSVLIESMKSSQHVRWVEKKGDKDFQVTMMNGSCGGN